MNTMTSKRKIISLFTGAGGLDLGFEAAGFETVVAVEMDDKCVETLRHNRKWPVIHRDIHAVSSSEILKISGLKKGESSLLIGGPPCQPFSKSGFWATGESKRLKDPRASTLDEYLRVLRDTLPKAFLLENVAGIGYKGKAEGLEYLLRRVEDINQAEDTNYRIETLRVNAAHYGVPQIRERLLLIAHRDGFNFGQMNPTHAWQRDSSEQNDFLDDCLEEPTNAWDAIGHLTGNKDRTLAVKGKWASLLPSIPEGGNYLYHTERGEGEALFGWRRRFWNFLLKLSKDKPSWTLTAQPGPATGPFHWENRHLSPQELAALQTFPANYEILGTRAEAQKQVGNAVPSALAELVGLKMRARFFGEPECEVQRATLVPAKRTDMPRRKRVHPVVAEYLDLIGDHSAHPGTGKGYGAKRLKALS
jgi:DNA (cytosine-5)-methyltransferase 1